MLPFDAALGLPDDLARRIARNTQSILHDESSLGRVLDAAGGSWYVEALTDELAHAAWDGFTAIERAGGALAALDSGLIGDRIAAARDQRAADVAHRRAPLTGVSEFALPDEPAVPRPPAPPGLGGGPLLPARWAAGFEALRDAVEAVSPRPSRLPRDAGADAPCTPPGSASPGTCSRRAASTVLVGTARGSATAHPSPASARPTRSTRPRR